MTELNLTTILFFKKKAGEEEDLSPPWDKGNIYFQISFYFNKMSEEQIKGLELSDQQSNLPATWHIYPVTIIREREVGSCPLPGNVI